MATKVDTVVSVILDASGVAVGVKDASGQIRTLQGRFMALKDGMSQAEKGTEQFAQAIKQVTKAAQEQEKAFKVVTKESSSLKAVLEGMFKPVTALNQAFGVLQQSLYVIQRAFSLTVGSAMDLELEVARITTVLEKAEVGQVDFAKRILDMQRTFGANPTEAAKGFYEAIASGATNAAGSIELMATAQKLAIGGLLPLDKALSGLTSVMASYGYSADQTRYISDAFFIAAAKGKTNVEELTQEIGNVASIAEQSGVSFEELVSAISAVTLGGKRTAEATTSVRSAINALLTPTEDLRYIYRQLGIESIIAEIRQRGLAAVYDDIYKKVKNNAGALSQLVGRIEAVSAVVALTSGKQKVAYQEMLKSITDSTRKMGDATERAVGIIEKTSSRQMEIAKGKIVASFTEISTAAMKIIIPIAELGATIVDKLLKPIAAVSNAVSVMVDGLDKTAFAITAIITGLAALKIPAIAGFFAALAPVLKAVAVPAAIVAAKFIGIAAAVTAVALLVDQIVRNFKLIPDVFEYVIESLDKFVSAMVIKLNQLLIGLYDFAQSIANKFPNISETLGIKFSAERPNKEIKDLEKNLETAAENAKKAKEKIEKSWNMGAIGEITKALQAFSNTFKDTGVEKPKDFIGPPQRPKVKEEEPINIAKEKEKGKKATEQLNAMLEKERQYQKDIELSKLTGEERAKRTIELEYERIDTLSQQADAYEKLTSEQLKQIDLYKEKFAEKLQIELNVAKIEEATGYIDAAMKGADAVVSKGVQQVGTMVATAMGLPPQVGEMISGLVNFLRQGYDAVKNFGKELVKIVTELPLMIAEGLLGLVDGLIEGVLNMLEDPARLAKIQTSFMTLGPKIVTSIIKAIPALFKILLNPKFWAEFYSQMVRSIWEAIKEMFYALGDLFAEIFGWGVKKAEEEQKPPQQQIQPAALTDMTTGYQSQLFAVQEEEQAKKTLSLAQKINDAFSAGIRKASSWWDDLKSWFEKNWISVLLAPFTMGLSLLLDNEKWKEIGRKLDENIFQPIINWFKTHWIGIILAPFTGGLSLIFSNEKIEKAAKDLWDGLTGAFKRFGNWLSEIFTLPDSAKKDPGPVEKFLGLNFPFITFAEGGVVPGRAKVFGDSSKNDTVPALLSPGEVVIPRSIMQDPKAARAIGAIVGGQEVGMHAGGLLGGIIDFFVPKEIQDLFDSLSRFISGLDIKKFVTDPTGAIKNAIRGAMDFLKKPFMNLLKAPTGFNQGGFVPGTGFTDTVPAMLTPGEFVINRNAAQALGGGLLSQLNQGRFAQSTEAPVINLNLNIETKDALDETFVRQRLIPTMRDELKRASLRGDFIISAKGIR